MKNKTIMYVLLISLLVVACKSKTHNAQEYSNIELNDFTKEFITMYLNDSTNRDVRNMKDEIIINSHIDSTHNYLSVFAKGGGVFDFYSPEFIGQTRFQGHRVRVYGDVDSIFFKIKEKNKLSVNYDESFRAVCYDPSVWVFCLYRDKSFCKMRTQKTLVEGDIFDIQNLASKFFAKNDSVEDVAFEIVDTHARLFQSDDSLQSIIRSNIKPQRYNGVDRLGKIPIIIRLLVAKDGKATFYQFIRNTGDDALDGEAKRIANIICRYTFTPGSHRGETVKSYYDLFFYNKDIIHSQP